MISKIYIRAIFALAIVFTAVQLSAQSPMSLYFLETLPQTNNTNPASTPRANVFVSIPSAYAGMHTDLAAEDLLQKQSGQWVTPIDKSFNYDDLYKSIGESGSFSAEVCVAPLAFGFRTGEKGYFTFSIAERAMTRGNMASDMFKIVENGLPSETRLDLTKTGARSIVYKELSFGYAREIDEKLTVGVHVKPLFGQLAAVSEIDNFVVQTGESEYAMQVKGSVYASAPMEVEEGEDGFPKDVEMDDIEPNTFTGLKNSGLAFDFGGVYRFNDKIVLSAALNNLGFIRWRQDLHSLSVSGEYKYDGVELNLNTLDSIGDMLENELDTIKNVLDGDMGNGKFSTGLTPSLYLGGQYMVNNSLSMGLLLRSTFEKYNFRQEFCVSANWNPRQFLTLGLNYNKEINGSSAIGMALALRGGPLQFYVVADHIPFKYNTIQDNGTSYPVPMHLESFSLMTGINFVFGANGNGEKVNKKKRRH